MSSPSSLSCDNCVIRGPFYGLCMTSVLPLNGIKRRFVLLPTGNCALLPALTLHICVGELIWRNERWTKRDENTNKNEKRNMNEPKTRNELNERCGTAETHVKSAFRSRVPLKLSECFGRTLVALIWQPTRLLKTHMFIVDIIQHIRYYCQRFLKFQAIFLFENHM